MQNSWGPGFDTDSSIVDNTVGTELVMMRWKSLGRSALYISSLPYLATVVLTRASICTALLTSVWTKIASPPLSMIRSWVVTPDSSADRAVGVRSAQATFAPSAAYRIAIARPRPEEAPVTIAILFSRRGDIFCVSQVMTVRECWVESIECDRCRYMYSFPQAGCAIPFREIASWSCRCPFSGMAIGKATFYNPLKWQGSDKIGEFPEMINYID